MKKLQKFFALTAAMAMLANSGYSQDGYPYFDEPYAYEDSGDASDRSALLPIGIIVVAGIIFALSHHHHDHHSTSCHCH